MRDVSFLLLLLTNIFLGESKLSPQTALNSQCSILSCGGETVDNGEICRELSDSGEEIWSPCETNNLCLYDEDDDEFYCELVFGAPCDTDDDCEFDLESITTNGGLQSFTMALSCRGSPGTCNYPGGMPGDACESDDDCGYSEHCHLQTQQCRLPITGEACSSPRTALDVFSIDYLPCGTDASVASPAVCVHDTCQTMLQIDEVCTAATADLCGVNGGCNINSTGISGVCTPFQSQATGTLVSDSAFCMCGFRNSTSGRCQPFFFGNTAHECSANTSLAHSSTRPTGQVRPFGNADVCDVVPSDIGNATALQGMCGCNGAVDVTTCLPGVCDEADQCMMQFGCMTDPAMAEAWLNMLSIFYYNPCPLGGSLCANIIPEPSAIVTATCALRPLSLYSPQFLWCSNPFASCDVCDCNEDDDDDDDADYEHGFVVGLCVGGFVLLLAILTCVCRGGEIRHDVAEERQHLFANTIPPPTIVTASLGRNSARSAPLSSSSLSDES